jgi:F-box/TPR repeat protein Pof3
MLDKVTRYNIILSQELMERGDADESQLLKKAHKECLDIVSPPRSVDPLTVLPRELAQIILEYLSFRQRMNVCLVSRGWNRYILSLPDLWSHLDLSEARKKVRSAFISKAINHGRIKLRKATLDRLYDPDKVLTALVRNCRLEELTILDCSTIGSEAFVDAMKRSKNLKTLTFNPELTVSDFRGGPSQSTHGIHQAWMLLSGQLESIRFARIRDLELPPQCERLTQFHAEIENFPTTAKLLSAASEIFPNIHSLTVKCLQNSVSNVYQFYDLALCQHLTHLDLTLSFRLSPGITLPATLETLRFDPLNTGMPYANFDRILLNEKALRLPALQELSISWGTSQDGSHVCAMLQGFENVCAILFRCPIRLFY